jgi:hypothetical protein
MTRTSAGLIFLLLLLPTIGAAQQDSLVVTVTRSTDLTFGTVYTGTTAQVLQSDATSAEFIVTGAADSTVTLTFSLPQSIKSGAATLPVSFGTADAAWSEVEDVAGRTVFDPNQGTQITMPAQAVIYVWVGGRISPGLSQPSGGYAGTLSLSAVVN